MGIMGNKAIAGFAFVIAFFSLTCFHGVCMRNIYGQVKTTTPIQDIKVTVCRYYGAGKYPDCNTVTLNETGQYTVAKLGMDQKNCNNDCNGGKSTMPDSINIKVSISRIPVDTLVKDTTFSCAQGYTFSGDDIHLPDITIP